MSPYSFEKQRGFTYSLNIHGEHSNIIYNFISELVPYSVVDSCITLSCANIVPLNEYLASRENKLSVSECIQLIDNIMIIRWYSVDWPKYNWVVYKKVE